MSYKESTLNLEVLLTLKKKPKELSQTLCPILISLTSFVGFYGPELY